MEHPPKVVIDGETNMVTLVDLTKDEIAAREKAYADFLAKEEAEVANKVKIQALKESAKAKLVAGDPLTPEEAEVIVF